MPKMKTHKASRKRIKISGRSKFLSRTAGQDHFNAREPGSTTMRKRRDHVLTDANRRKLRRAIPYYRNASK